MHILHSVAIFELYYSFIIWFFIWKLSRNRKN